MVDETVPPDAISALVEVPGALPDLTNSHRVLIGGAKLEILGVGPLDERDLDGIPPNDALFVASHVWALDTATPLTLVASYSPTVRATAPFATPAALVAMKLHAVQDRSASAADKRAADAWDIYQLLVEHNGQGSISGALLSASTILKELVREAAEHVLVTGAARTVTWMRSGDLSMAAATQEELRFLGERLIEALA
ncbi:MAG TPA: hypothetical protein VFP61_15565 [Acidimicrobiales bacterium]|nr:hypothetical protein [Acidimicrobiales bacterium]